MGQQQQTFDLRLGDQQAIERILVQRRQRVDGDRVLAADRQFDVAVVEQAPSEQVGIGAEVLAAEPQRLRELAPNLDAIILEDYGKGFMTEKLMQLVAKIAAEHQLIVTVDPSPRNPLPWAGVSLVKPNRLEAFAAAGLEDHLLSEAPLENNELLEVGRVLLAKWNVASVLVTLGEQGMMLFERGQPPHHIPTRAREVFDVAEKNREFFSLSGNFGVVLSRK